MEADLHKVIVTAVNQALVYSALKDRVGRALKFE